MTRALRFLEKTPPSGRRWASYKWKLLCHVRYDRLGLLANNGSVMSKYHLDHAQIKDFFVCLSSVSVKHICRIKTASGVRRPYDNGANIYLWRHVCRSPWFMRFTRSLFDFVMLFSTWRFSSPQYCVYCV